MGGRKKPVMLAAADNAAASARRSRLEKMEKEQWGVNAMLEGTIITFTSTAKSIFNNDLEDTITTVTDTAKSIVGNDMMCDDDSISITESVSGESGSITDSMSVESMNSLDEQQMNIATVDSTNSEDEQHNIIVEDRRDRGTNVEKEEERQRNEKKQSRRNSGTLNIMKKGRKVARKLSKQLKKKDERKRKKKSSDMEAEEEGTWFHDLSDKFGLFCGCAANYDNDGSTVSYDSSFDIEEIDGVPTFEL